MLSNQEKIELYNDKLEFFSTNIEMLSKSIVDSKAFVKVSSITSALIIPSVSAAVYYLKDIDANQLAFYATIASVVTVGGIVAFKKAIDYKNEDINAKICDNLRDIDLLSDKIAELENMGDNSIAQSMVENRGKLLKRTM